MIILKWVLIREKGAVGCGLKRFEIGTSEGLLYTVCTVVLQHGAASGLDRVTGVGEYGIGLSE